MLEALLKKYWGYDSFRPMQRHIIVSVMQGEDTLALLPTGGGKSICYQLPAVAKEGVCIVFSPLIALMKDQVDGLNKRGISAVALHSGLSKGELDTELQNALYGKYKLVYLSPERAATQLFRSYLPNLNVSFFVIDEAHCISQWGHQFRPEYLRIGELREILPDVNMVAVTATATEHVQQDIIKYLAFKSKYAFYKQSFKRDNLSYLVMCDSNKLARIAYILKKTKGTGIVYANTRRKCEEISVSLNKEGISTAYYHGGLENEKRAQVQQAWIDNKLRIVACTNAFGMGIDKPDVRIVIHYEKPEGPEAYYQEAGRAGRDGLEAYCVLLAEKHEVERIVSYPTIKELEHALLCLYNYHQIAFSAGKGITYKIDLLQFAENFKLPPRKVVDSISGLHSLGFLKLNENIFQLPRVKFIVPQIELYAYQVKNPIPDMFIKLLLRSYGGMFEHYVTIKYGELAKRQQCTIGDIVKQLKHLHKDGVIDFIESEEGNSITYLEARPTKLIFDKMHYAMLRDRQDERRAYIQRYAENRDECRENLLLAYFGEKNETRCGKCDICRLLKKSELNTQQFSEIKEKIKQLCVNKNLELEAILHSFDAFEERQVATVIKWLLDNEYLTKENQKYTWNTDQE